MVYRTFDYSWRITEGFWSSFKNIYKGREVGSSFSSFMDMSGRVAERPIAPVLKTGLPKGNGGSNPSSSVSIGRFTSFLVSRATRTALLVQR